MNKAKITILVDFAKKELLRLHPEFTEQDLNIIFSNKIIVKKLIQDLESKKVLPNQIINGLTETNKPWIVVRKGDKIPREFLGRTKLPNISEVVGHEIGHHSILARSFNDISPNMSHFFTWLYQKIIFEPKYRKLLAKAGLILKK